MSNFDKLGKQISEVDATMDAWIAKLGEKKTAQLFALLAEFCTVCREQIDKTDTVA